MDIEMRLPNTYDPVCLFLMHTVLTECSSYGIYPTVTVCPTPVNQDLWSNPNVDLDLCHNALSLSRIKDAVICIDDGSNPHLNGAAMVQVCIPDFPHPVILDGGNTSAYAACVRYLFDIGHRCITFITGDMSVLGNAERMHIFLQAAHSYPDITTNVVHMNYSLTTVPNIVHSLVTHRSTAFVCSTDMVAMSVMHELSNLGLTVPQNYSVVGYGDIPEASLQTPTLTTIRLPFKRSAKTLVQIIREFDFSHTVDMECLTFRSEFMIRQSTSKSSDAQEELQ